jgi:hypothetical protein
MLGENVRECNILLYSGTSITRKIAMAPAFQFMVTCTSINRIFDNSSLFLPPTDLSYRGSTVFHFCVGSKLVYYKLDQWFSIFLALRPKFSFENLS